MFATLGKIITSWNCSSTHGSVGDGCGGQGSGARGVVASEALIDTVQQVLRETIPGTGQHLLKANDGFQAQPGGEGNGRN